MRAAVPPRQRTSRRARGTGALPRAVLDLGAEPDVLALYGAAHLCTAWAYVRLDRKEGRFLVELKPKGRAPKDPAAAFRGAYEDQKVRLAVLLNDLPVRAEVLAAASRPALAEGERAPRGLSPEDEAEIRALVEEAAREAEPDPAAVRTPWSELRRR